MALVEQMGVQYNVVDHCNKESQIALSCYIGVELPNLVQLMRGHLPQLLSPRGLSVSPSLYQSPVSQAVPSCYISSAVPPTVFPTVLCYTACGLLHIVPPPV